MQDYEKGPVLGYGTYGSVRRFLHKPSGRTVAIKKVQGGGSKGGDSLRIEGWGLRAGV